MASVRHGREKCHALRATATCIPGQRWQARPTSAASGAVAEGDRAADGGLVIPEARPVATEPRWRLWARYAVSDGVPKRSLRVALVVGTVLNLINQGEAVFGAAPVNWFKVLLTFAMPYAVSTYGAVAVRLGDRGRPNAD